MSYQVLARKWRPRNFSELVGQEHVLRALVNALDNDRLHHAFLFTGTRGVGKTTIARILAKSINCEKGMSSTPCGECSACTEINEGRFVDLIEVDAASRTKVEDTRELLENVQYAPTRGRYKVYLIDEVHMLSTHSFNALLKTLEEPPPHVKFLLATTDPQKLPVTILSRCLQFNLKRLPLDQIKTHLGNILKSENIDSDSGAINAIAHAADGSMRDALSLLDQAIAYGSGALNVTDVHAMLGSIEQNHITDLIGLLAQGDAKKLLERVATLAEQSPDFSSVLNDTISCLHRIALAQAVPDAIDDLYADKETIQSLAQQLSPQDTQLYYQIGLIGRRDLSLAPDAKSGFEMVLLRMLAFKPAELGTAVSSPATSKQAPAVKPSTVSTTSNATNDKNISANKAVSPAAALKASLLSEQQAKKKVATNVGSGIAATQENFETVKAEPITARPPAPTSTAETNKSPSEDQWENLILQCNLNGLAQQLAMNCCLLEKTTNQIHLCIAPNRKQLLSDSRRDVVQQALQSLLGNQVQVTIDIQETTSLSPAALEQQRRENRQAEAVSTIENDDAVKNLMDTFGARISPGSIHPVDE